MLWIYRIRYLVRGIWLRVRFLFRKGAAEEEMEEEVRFHLEQEVRRNVSRGLSPREARRTAHVHFGATEQVKEEVRGARGIRPMEEFLTDSRLALRQLRKTPAFALVAVLTLGIGIGINTSIFSLVNGALLKGRPFTDPGTLVMVYTEIRDQTPFATSFTADIHDLRSLDDVFSEVAAYRGMPSRIEEADGASMVMAEAVSEPVNDCETLFGVN